MQTKPSKPAAPAVEAAAKDAVRQEVETSALTPVAPDPATPKWPFPPSTDYLPEEPHDQSY
jgi:hypothetical protein